MKTRSFHFAILISSWMSIAPLSPMAQDRAVYEVFSQNAPAVYSISVEIPKNVLMDRYSESFERLKAPEFIESSSPIGHFNIYNYLMQQWEQKINIIKQQMLSNNRVRGIGFAIDRKHLVTLASVIESATYGGAITIENKSRKYTAQVTGVDEMTGVALLEVQEATFDVYVDITSHPSFSRQEASLPIGSFVMTIQRPYDLPASPFSGMIGGYFRILQIFDIERYIQTDLPLYPGNEGSPVFSPSGRFLGMLAARYSVDNWPSLTFAIPADIIVDSAKSLINDGKSERGWIPGLSVTVRDGQLVINSVESNSPAEQAGLKVGDRIIGFEGRVEDIHYLLFKMRMSRPNKKVTIEIQRGDELFYKELTTKPVPYYN